jgi:hypothetical protein
MFVVCTHPKKLPIDDLKVILEPGEIREFTAEQACSTKDLYVAISQRRVQSIPGSPFSAQLRETEALLKQALDDGNAQSKRASDLEDRLQELTLASSKKIKDLESRLADALKKIKGLDQAEPEPADEGPEVSDPGKADPGKKEKKVKVK